jgi:hypothetical protein
VRTADPSTSLRYGRDDKGRGVAQVGVVAGRRETAVIRHSSSSKKLIWTRLEQFSYDLKMLKRATLVGETTRGGSHAGVFHRMDDDFGMGIPEQKVINPFGKTDWEGVGVEPDVKVSAAEALETAVKLAEARVGTK